MNGKKGFTLLEIMIVVAIIGILVAGSALNSYRKSTEKTQETVCRSNRGLIERAEQLYFMEHGEHPANIYDLINEGYLKNYPKCPIDGVYAWMIETDDSDNERLTVVCSVHGVSQEEGDLTSIGSTFEDITDGMIELIQNFYNEEGRYPRSWGDYVFTDIGLDPEEWQQGYEGVIYTPVGSSIKIEPDEGYQMIVTDTNGDQKILTPDLNWSIWYDMKTEKWYYHRIKSDNEINIETLVIQKEQ